jgi:putative redox protein
MQSTVRLNENMAFDVEAEGHRFLIDAKPEHGGENRGPTPKVLMTTALAGCAAMDIIAILRKMKVEPETLSVTADSGPLTEKHPKTFTDMAVRVEATGGIPAKKLWKAVAMSRDRYCGVAAMMRAHGPIAYTVVLDGEEIPESGT